MSLADLLKFESSEPFTEHQQELERIHLYLATKDPEDIRLVQRMAEVVLEELKESKRR